MGLFRFAVVVVILMSIAVTTEAPSITNLSPQTGPVGATVTIAGAGFGAMQGNSIVTFNGTPAQPVRWSATDIVVHVPAGASTGQVVVTVGGAASNSVAFSVSSAR
jgi:hypothetical protein